MDEGWRRMLGQTVASRWLGCSTERQHYKRHKQKHSIVLVRCCRRPCMAGFSLRCNIGLVHRAQINVALTRRTWKVSSLVWVVAAAPVISNINHHPALFSRCGATREAIVESEKCWEEWQARAQLFNSWSLRERFFYSPCRSLVWVCAHQPTHRVVAIALLQCRTVKRSFWYTVLRVLFTVSY